MYAVARKLRIPTTTVRSLLAQLKEELALAAHISLGEEAKDQILAYCAEGVSNFVWWRLGC